MTAGSDFFAAVFLVVVFLFAGAFSAVSAFVVRFLVVFFGSASPVSVADFFTVFRAAVFRVVVFAAVVLLAAVFFAGAFLANGLVLAQERSSLLDGAGSLCNMAVFFDYVNSLQR